MRNILTIDVEDYFHPSEVQRTVAIDDWPRLPSRVVYSTNKVLELLAKHDVRATFFVLGWVAEKFPELVRAIRRQGHEIGCHSYAHLLVYEMTQAEFRADTERAVAAIEAACGLTPRMYRAPSYSVTRQSMWALDILAELGFTHDSSIYPISHDRYGIPGFPRHTHEIDTRHGKILEVTVASVKLSNQRVAPVGGGGYLRLLPYRYTAAGIRRINKEEGQSACLYLHPWEVDPDQPRLASGLISRIRTYHGLRNMEKKLSRLLDEFEFVPIGDVYPAARKPASVEAPAHALNEEPLPLERAG